MLFLPVRVGDGEDEEVEHVEELPVLGPRHQVVQHVGHRGRADPLPSVDTCTTDTSTISTHLHNCQT